MKHQISDHSMDSRCQILLYFDKRHLLEKIQEDCKKFLNETREKSMTKTLPWRYFMEIDVMDLLNSFPDLGQILLTEPSQWRKLCIEVLYACLENTINDCDFLFQPAQVNLVIRLTSVPKTFVSPNKHSFSGLVSFEGMLVSMTKPKMYVYHSVWVCPEECEGSEIVLQNTPKCPPKCSTCRSITIENSGLRRCGEQMTIMLLVKNQLMPRSILVADDIIPKLAVGSNYLVTGAVLKKTFTVWSVEEVKTLPCPSTMPMNDEIMDLYRACHGVPWKFIYCLASSFGVNVCPLHCFMHLKVGLLMSLASVKSNAMIGAPLLHILVAGLDTSYVGRIMIEATSLADTRVILSSNTNVVTSLIASSGGACVLPLPLYIYSQKQTSSILSIIESNEIVDENQKVPLQCVVWAQGMDFKKIVLLNVANVFGFVCHGDYGNNSDEIADFMLQNAVEPQKDESKNVLKELKKYIEVIAAIKVSLDDSTETLLRKYFLAARRERQRAVSVGSISGLVATTMMSARLCRRNVASIDDGVFAIWLHVSGSPEPRIAPEEYLQTPGNVKTLHKSMLKFKEWLADFIGCDV